jgi:hypothetical protein
VLELLNWLRELTPAGWHEGIRGVVAALLFLLPIFGGLAAIWWLQRLTHRLRQMGLPVSEREERRS